VRGTSAARNWLMAALSVLLGAVALGIPTRAADGDAVPGGQGTDTSLPLTDSAVTISGRGPFADLEITVNQTRDLAEQAISITWEGGTRTETSPGRFGAHFLQIFQCWGDDDGTVPANPGPPPEQCVFGGYGARYGGFSGGIYPEQLAITREISNPGWENYDPSDGVPDPVGTALWRPFRAVDGSVVGAHTNASYRPTVGGDFWLNPYFNLLTTNEIPGGFTFPDGKGAELFQVLTGVQSSGLGCGQRVERVDSEFRIPKCWLVIVPRGDATSENVGTPFEPTAADVGVATSPLAPEAWKNRIAVPLEFNPVDSPCQLGQDERRLSGNETAFAAVASWQPALCAGQGLPPFSYAPVGDPAARRQLATPSVGAPGMVVVSRALAAEQVRPENPVVYAPLTLSGLAIGFNIERKFSSEVPLAERARFSGTRVAEINLTPRLVAKLLTQSYRRAISVGLTTPPYDWPKNNPQSLVNDPDFIQFNPEFALLTSDNRNVSSLTVPAGNSDAAQQLWEWILDDDEARAWLDGAPDSWGMVVNPVYSTNPEVNTTGFPFGSPSPVSFPRSDPYCYQPPPLGSQGIVAPPLCGTDWLPYAGGFDLAAQITRRADDKAKIVLNQFAPSSSTAWGQAGPQSLGERAIAAVVDSSSAARYGLQVARLSNADDNGPDRRFLPPDELALVAAVEAMEPGDDPTVLDPKLPAPVPGAYPLTMVTYAAIAPLALDDDARADYAKFLEYAVGPGQSPGSVYGSLPVGYVPLPEDLRAQSREAATAVRTLTAPAAAPSPEPPAAESPAPTTSSSALPTTNPVAPAVTTPGTNLSQGSTATASSRPRASSSQASSPSSDPLDSTAPSSTDVPEGSSEPAVDAPVVSSPPADPPAASPTPSQARVATRLAVPVLGSVGLLSALAALELTKRPRRLQSTASGKIGDTP
jgi:hypothetical protein